MKKSNITMTLIMSLYALVIIVSIIMDNILPFIIGFLLIIIFEYITVKQERKKIYQKLMEFTRTKEYDLAIEYLLNKKHMCFYEANNKTVIVNLIDLYALQNDFPNAKKYLNYKRIREHKSLYYIRFLICLSDGDFASAKMIARRLMRLKNPIYDEQKNSVRKIFKMFKTKVCDDELLENTNYQYIRDLCLKYKNGEEVKFFKKSYQTKKALREKTQFKENLLVKIFSIVLFIVATAGGILFLAFLYMLHYQFDLVSQIDWLCYIKYNLPIIWGIFVLPLVCLIFGIVLGYKGYKTKKNIIQGIIVTIMIFVVGVIPFINYRTYSTELDYLFRTGRLLDVSIPYTAEIITTSWPNGESSSDGIIIEHEAIIKFYDEDEFKTFRNRISFLDWKATEEELAFLPNIFTNQTKDCEYHMSISFVDQDTNIRTYIYAAVDVDKEYMLIFEYRI